VSLLSVRKIYVYIISLLLIISTGELMAQTTPATEPPDTVTIPLAIRTGIDISGPVIYLTDKSILNVEGYLSADLNEKRSLYLAGGYANYKHSQSNYNYLTHGIFFKAGVDFNLMKPQTAMGKYWAGVGIRYGITSFTYEIPELSHDNYWGTTTVSIPSQSQWGHFIEASPGFRAQLFGSLYIGWSISLRKMIYSGSNKDIKPIYIPGYGLASSSISTGINYFLIWNFRYKTIKVLIKKEPPEEPEENAQPSNQPSTNPGAGKIKNMDQ
jgi:hypothetical protein